MSTQFGATYASVYDTLYAEKDYEAECDQIVRAFGRGDASVKRILDLGAGTGNHAIPLARRGYDVVGVDISPDMVERARAKVPGSLNLRFEVGDVRTARVPETFDAALMMFAVLGYQTTNEDVRAAIENAARHLRPGGLFLFDVWHAPAVLRHPPGERVRVQPTSTGRVIRLTTPELDAVRNLCKVRFRTFALSGAAVQAETEETHVMRYFSIPELDAHLAAAGFEPGEYTAFPSGDVTPDSWNIMCVARKSA